MKNLLETEPIEQDELLQFEFYDEFDEEPYLSAPSPKEERVEDSRSSYPPLSSLEGKFWGLGVNYIASCIKKLNEWLIAYRIYSKKKEDYYQLWLVKDALEAQEARREEARRDFEAFFRSQAVVDEDGDAEVPLKKLEEYMEARRAEDKENDEKDKKSAYKGEYSFAEHRAKLFGWQFKVKVPPEVDVSDAFLHRGGLEERRDEFVNLGAPVPEYLRSPVRPTEEHLEVEPKKERQDVGQISKEGPYANNKKEPFANKIRGEGRRGGGERRRGDGGGGGGRSC